MKASEKSLTFLRDQLIYIVPYFQRGYVWDESNWDGIWQELTAKRKDSFLGSIILKEEEYLGREEKCKTIIDGQQRLTTLTILLRALLDYYVSKGVNDSETLQHFRELIFYRYTQWLETGTVTTEKCRIEHSRLNKKDYTDVIEGNVDVSKIVMPTEEGEPSSKILRCYRFFLEKLQNAAITEINQVREKLIVDTNKILVVIDLNDKENEQVIFDTINSTGVKLTASDIIKNALFQKIKQAGQSIEEFYVETWQQRFENTEEVRDLWLDTKGIGQNQRSNIDLFFYSFAIIEGFFSVPGDKMSDLAMKYKEFISDFTAEQTKEFIRKICEYANIYMDTFIGFDDITAYTYNDSKIRLLQILNAMKITAFDPFILFALKTYDDAKQIDVFKKLECYVMRHYVIGNTSKMGRFLQDAADMISGKFDFDEKLADDLISDVRFERALKYVNNTKARLLLFWVELYRHTQQESDLYNTPLNYAYELEHIMPQKWTAYWGLEVLPVLDDNGDPLPADVATRTRNDAVYEIGNMTLLTSKLNKTLQNYCFKDKVEGAVISKKQRFGMKKFASLSITKEVINVDPLVWDEKKIYERTKVLTKEILSIWSC